LRKRIGVFAHQLAQGGQLRGQGLVIFTFGSQGSGIRHAHKLPGGGKFFPALKGLHQF
jgi:hypothetical protein